MTARMAWQDSGAAMMPSERAKVTPASKVATCGTASASTKPSLWSWDTSGESPW